VPANNAVERGQVIVDLIFAKVSSGGDLAQRSALNSVAGDMDG
jgi:hypothetical protein